METRRVLTDELAKAHDDAELIRVDAEEEGLPRDDRAGDNRNEE